MRFIHLIWSLSMNHYKFFFAAIFWVWVWVLFCWTWTFCRASFCSVMYVEHTMYAVRISEDFALFSSYTWFLLASDFCFFIRLFSFGLQIFLFKTLNLIDNRWFEWQRKAWMGTIVIILCWILQNVINHAMPPLYDTYSRSYCLNEKWA